MTKTSVIFQETPRTYRTEIPNIIFVMLESGEISKEDFVLYSTYRRIAGQNGACWYGTRDLEKKCGMADKTITKSKKNLAQKFKTLNGKSLIKIKAGNKYRGQADTVTIMDIWPENHKFFSESCSKSDDRSVPPNTTGLSYSRRHKNEPSKKEPYKKKSIKEPVESVDKSKIPKPPDKSIGSIPSSTEEFSIVGIDSPELMEIFAREEELSKVFRPDVLARWIRKFGPKYVLETINYFFQILKTQKKEIPKPEAWMEQAFKKNFVKSNKQANENKKFAEDIKNKYAINRLKIKQRYCLDTQTGNDYYYNLPKETFIKEISKIIE